MHLSLPSRPSQENNGQLSFTTSGLISWIFTEYRLLKVCISFQQVSKKIVKYKNIQGFPGGTVVENLPANAGDAVSSPGLGRSHMPRSNWAREPQLLSLCVWSLCSATREATMEGGPRTVMKSGPRLPRLERALVRKQRPNTARNT